VTIIVFGREKVPRNLPKRLARWQWHNEGAHNVELLSEQEAYDEDTLSDKEDNVRLQAKEKVGMACCTRNLPPRPLSG
jgi:hypothetical protein